MYLKVAKLDGRGISVAAYNSSDFWCCNLCACTSHPDIRIFFCISINFDKHVDMESQHSSIGIRIWRVCRNPVTSTNYCGFD